MKKRLLNLYIIFVILLFIFSLGIFGYNLFTEYYHGENRCNRRFEHLTSTLNQNYILSSNGFNQENIEKAVGSLDDFSFINISNENHSIYNYPADIINSDNTSSKFVKIYSASINTEKEKYTIKAGLYILRPVEIGKYAKISFLIILIATIITILILIVISVNDKSSKIYENSHSEKIEDDFDSSVKTADEILSEKPLNFEVSIPETISEKKEETTTDFIDDKVENIENKEVSSYEESTIEENHTFIKDQSLNQTVEEESEVKNETELKSAENQIENEVIIEKESNPLPVDEIKPMEIKDSEENPKGLFDPATGIGWESYMLTRLENELNRAISSEIDLALFVIKLPGINRDYAVLKQICDYLIIQFQFKDLIFEYKDDSIVAIKISANIDDAMNLAERINEDVNKMLSDYPSKCFIGISTRTIRMMSAERLLKEADEALAHAQEDPSTPIIAFRADAIKYQKFLEDSLK